MTDALEDHKGTVSIGGRVITNLCFADGISGLAREEELAKLVGCLDKSFTAYGMEISAERTKLMKNNTSGKQHQQHQQGDQSKQREACDNHKLQMPGLSCF